MTVLLHRKKSGALGKHNNVESPLSIRHPGYGGSLELAGKRNRGGAQSELPAKRAALHTSYGIPCPDGKMRRRRSLLFPRVNLAIFAPSRTPCSRRIRTQRSYSAGPPEPKRPESFRVHPAAVDDAPTAAAQALQIHKQAQCRKQKPKGGANRSGNKKDFGGSGTSQRSFSVSVN